MFYYDLSCVFYTKKEPQNPNEEEETVSNMKKNTVQKELTTACLKQNSNLKGVIAIDLRAGLAGVFGLFSTAAKDL